MSNPARWLFVIGLIMSLGVSYRAHAQDGLNLPTELYILLNDGVVERYGLGMTGRARVTPAADFVLDFQVAPDGTWLAYRTQAGLFMVDMYDSNATPIALAGADVSIPYARGRGETLAWSADSRALAFTTLGAGGVYLLDEGRVVPIEAPELVDLLWSPDGRYLAARAEGDIWWVFARSASNLTLTSIVIGGTSAAWLDLTRLVYTPAEGGVTLMDMAQANAQTVLLPGTRRYHLPLRVDERTLHIFSISAEGDERLGRLERISLDEGDNAQIVVVGQNDISLNGVRWTPDENLVTVFRGGVLALVNAMTGEGFTLPVTSASAYGWAPAYPPMRDQLPLTDSIHYIAPAPDGIAQVWVARGDNTFPRTITPALADISDYAIAPDGVQVAYVSAGQLWWLDTSVAQAEAVPLIELGVGVDVAPAFSADGGRIFYRDVQGEEAGIWVVDIGERTASLIVRDFDVAEHYRPRPSLSVSAMTVMVRSPEDARNGVLLVDTTSGEQAFLGNYTQSHWLGGSQLLVEGFIPRADIPFVGLHLLDVNNPQEPPFTLLTLEGDEGVLDVVQVGDTLRLLLQKRPPSRVRVVDVSLTGGAPSVVATIGYMASPRLSPDGGQVMGLTHENGSLVWLNLETNERYRLQGTFVARSLTWR